MQSFTLILVIVAAAASAKVHPRFGRSTKQECKNADKIESGIRVAYSGTANKPEARKHQALTILNWYKEWLNSYSNRQSFKAQDGAMVGFMWVGSMVQNSGFGNNVVTDFIQEINTQGMPEEIYYEFIHQNSMQSFGIILTMKGSDRAQKAVRLWSAGQSYQEQSGSKSSNKLAICYLAYGSRKPEANDNEAGPCDFSRLSQGSSPSGNVGEYLKAFNPGSDFSKSMPGQPYCYSEGSSPDFRRRKNDNGTCATYYIRKGDTCGALMAKYSPLKQEEIEIFNKNTYGWKGCNALQVNQPICVSEGKPPRPVPNPKAQCGPLAPGDLYDTECPNKACCSDFGFCGISSEFCEQKTAKGAPGTRGCYSNCGMGMLPTKKASSFNKVAYWLDTDGALYTDITKVEDYDVVQYAFATINDNDMSIGVGNGFERFSTISPKKVITFGGWEFSTSPSTYNILRKAVSDEHRDKFAKNVVDFMHTHGLDGVDFDWEYPEAPDIPDIPPGVKGDSERYVKLLKAIKDLDGSKSVSVAIPASYWYLKLFPLAKLNSVVDYFIFMNYDYVGQWDYGKPHTGIGCQNDRSLTEEAIKMIVKAGVDTTKVYGGSANYGRTFKLVDKNCKKYSCPFAGPAAATMAGEITNTKGFLSIGEINKSTFSDTNFNETSKCFYGVYNNNEDWVAWMKESDIKYTEEWYKNEVGLGGSVSWVLNYYKTEFSESPDNINCYYNNTISCEGKNMYTHGEISHKRELGMNGIYSLNRIFGTTNDLILMARRLQAYLYKLSEIKGVVASAATKAYVKAFRSSSEKLFDRMEKHFYECSQEERNDLIAMAFLLIPNFDLIRSKDFDRAMQWIDQSSTFVNRFEKITKESLTKASVKYRDRYVPAQAMMFNSMKITSPRLFRQVISADSPEVVLLDTGIYYGAQELTEHPTYLNEMSASSSEVESEDNASDDPDFLPDSHLGNAFEINDGLTPEEYRAMAFDQIPNGPVSYSLHRICSHQAILSTFRECVRRLESIRYSSSTINAVRSANEQRELGTTTAPLYVVNMAGGSTGVACNALLYLLSEDARSHMTRGGLVYLTRADPQRKKRSFSNKYATCISPDKKQKDEFPPASTKEGVKWTGEYRLHTARVACVEAADNSKEGSNLNRFYQGNPPNPEKDTDESQVDWTGIIPNQGRPSSRRRSEVKKGHKFYVAVNIGLDVDCSDHISIPKIREGHEWKSRKDGCRIKDKSKDHDEL
ncbi:hypothetical protein JCM33374_g6414 [Metschnikowia sp. JCM 33374]|nr:hypothetical protein JCM33374_g6414 [Metschnikowia sp. JCM 33374]